MCGVMWVCLSCVLGDIGWMGGSRERGAWHSHQPTGPPINHTYTHVQAWAEAITYIATVMIEGGNAEEAEVQRAQAENQAKFQEMKDQAAATAAAAAKQQQEGGNGGGEGGAMAM